LNRLIIVFEICQVGNVGKIKTKCHVLISNNCCNLLMPSFIEFHIFT
jgi:hypothetical protein